MKSILIIEDDQITSNYFKKVLSKNGYRPLTASNGMEGLDVVEEHSPDLIICDIMLPELDGYEILEKLRETQTAPATPFIFLTALGDRDDQRKGMDLGADDYLVKPVKSWELLNSVRTRLEKMEQLKGANLEGKTEERLQMDSTILLEGEDNIKAVVVGDILCIISEGVYSYVHSVNEKGFLTRKILKEWEGILPEEYFLRIHRSTLINVNQIEYIEKEDNSLFKIHLKHYKEPIVTSHRYSKKIKKLFFK